MMTSRSFWLALLAAAAAVASNAVGSEVVPFPQEGRVTTRWRRQASSGAFRPEGGCQLPPYPEHGSYEALQSPNLKPGDWVEEYNILSYSCKKGYGTSTPDVPLCVGGSWSTIPKCIKVCTLPKSFSVKFSCERAGQAVRCEETVPEGERLLTECIPGHSSEEQLDVLECVDGSWDSSVPRCKPDCGLEEGRGETISLNSRIAAIPWHVGIYRELRQVCSGSLLHPHIAISAAHCFWDGAHNVKIDAEHYKVAAGGFSPSDPFAQKSDVKALHLHERYQGDDLSQSYDLALVELKDPFSFNNHVRPVCYDWSSERLNDIQVAPGSVGKVAGWGRTETGEPSSELRTVTVPVVAYSTCYQEMKKWKFERYLTADKLCAGYTNGTTLCNGDSGGGLVFSLMDVFGLNRWYIRGVVSVAPVDPAEGSCRADTYMAFTEVFKLRDWLIKTTRRLNTAA